MTEDLHRAVELVELDRLLDDGYGAAGEDLAEDLTVRVTCDADDRKIRVHLLEAGIKLVSRDIRELEVEEDEVEVLLLGVVDSLRACSDDDASEAGFFEELLEEGLKGRIVIDDEDGGLAAFFVTKDVAIKQAALDPPTTTNRISQTVSAST